MILEREKSESKRYTPAKVLLEGESRVSGGYGAESGRRVTVHLRQELATSDYDYSLVLTPDEARKLAKSLLWGADAAERCGVGAKVS